MPAIEIDVRGARVLPASFEFRIQDLRTHAIALSEQMFLNDAIYANGSGSEAAAASRWDSRVD